MLLGLALRLRVGAGSGGGAEVTETLVVRLMEPPGPVQVSWKLLFEFRGPVFSLPDVDRLPDQPPLAWQLVALLLDQVSRVLEPLVTLLGLALRLRAGAGSGAASTVTRKVALSLPPGPVQVRE